MKKIVLIVLIVLLCTTAYAKSEEPKYKIVSQSYKESDIKEMYDVKTQLLKDYKIWAEGVDDKDQVLADHQEEYNAIYKQGVYYIVLGDGMGKTLSGDLKVNYCESTKEIKKRSFLFEWLFSW